MFYENSRVVFKMSEVAYVEKYLDGGIQVILNGSTWNNETKDYNNSVVLSEEEGAEFLKVWKTVSTEKLP